MDAKQDTGMGDNLTDLRSKDRLDLSASGIENLKHLHLRKCTNLQRLNLSGNKLCSVKEIAHNKELTWLNISNNNFTEFQALKDLKKLSEHSSIGSVQSIGLLLKLQPAYFYKCQLQQSHICKSFNTIIGLKALILNNNQISQVDDLTELKNLNSLVLSHNKIKNIHTRHFPSLAKLSLSHNDIEYFPKLEGNPKLKEIRLNGDRISEIPRSILSCKYLQLMDLGNNQISSLSAIKVIKDLKFLINLNLKGNPIEKMELYREKVSELCPTLKVLDGQKVKMNSTDAAGNVKSQDNSTDISLKRLEEVDSSQVKKKILEGGNVSSDAAFEIQSKPSKKKNARRGNKEKHKSKKSDKGPKIRSSSSVKTNINDADTDNANCTLTSDDQNLKKKVSTGTAESELILEKAGTQLSERIQSQTASDDDDLSGTRVACVQKQSLENSNLKHPLSTSVSESVNAVRHKSGISAKSSKQASESGSKKKAKRKMGKESGASSNQDSGASIKKARKAKREKIDPRTGIINVKNAKREKVKRTSRVAESVFNLAGFEFGSGEGGSWT